MSSTHKGLKGPTRIPLLQAFSEKLVRVTRTDKSSHGISGTTGEASFLRVAIGVSLNHSTTDGTLGHLLCSGPWSNWKVTLVLSAPDRERLDDAANNDLRCVRSMPGTAELEMQGDGDGQFLPQEPCVLVCVFVCVCVPTVTHRA